MADIFTDIYARRC